MSQCNTAMTNDLKQKKQQPTKVFAIAGLDGRTIGYKSLSALVRA